MWPDEINEGVQTFIWPFAGSDKQAYGVVAILCDGPFLFAPFDNLEEAAAYVVDDSYCYMTYSAWDLAWTGLNEFVKFEQGSNLAALATQVKILDGEYVSTDIDVVPGYMRYVFPQGLYVGASGDTLLFAYNEEGEHATLYGVNRIAGSYSEQITFDPVITSAVQRVALSPDAEYLVFSFISGNAVYKRNILGNYDFLNNDETFSTFATNYRFSPDSGKIASVDSNNYLVVYDFNAASPTLEFSTKIVGFDLGGTQDVKWLNDTNLIVSMFGSDDNKYYLMKGTIAAGELTISTVLETPFQAHFSISDDGSKFECHQTDQVIVFDYDVASNTVTSLMATQLPAELVNQVGSISPDGERFLASSWTPSLLGAAVYEIQLDNSLVLSS